MAHVGVVFGGRSVEHQVSIRSARTVAQGLREAGHTVGSYGHGGAESMTNGMRNLPLRRNVKAHRADGETHVGLIAWKAEIRDGEIVLGLPHEVVLGEGHGRTRTQVSGLRLFAFSLHRVGEHDRWSPNGSDSEVRGGVFQGTTPRVALNARIQAGLRC